jgi:hypothetical protein
LNALTWSWEVPELLAAAWLVPILAWSLAAAHRRLWSRSRLRWLLVSALNLLLALALASLLNPPEWLRPASQGAVLLTTGAEPAPASVGVFVTPDIETPPEAASLLLHAGQLPLRQPALGKLEIRGHGLEAAEARALPDGLDVTFQPPELEGLIRPDWPRTVTAGTPARLSAEFASQDQRPVDIELTDPGGRVIAEQRVPTGTPFQITFRPAAPGLAEYRLTVKRDDGILASEPVAIEVTGGRTVDLLVLQSAPSFEARALRRWAGDRGARVRVRTRVSEDRWISQGVNLTTEELDAEPNPALLGRIDLLVVDGRAWATLSEDRRSWISDAVEQGLGLLILADTALLETPKPGRGRVLDGFELEAQPGTPTETIPALSGMDSDMALPLAAIAIGGPAIHPMLAGASGELIEAWRDHGFGRVAVSRLSERFRWAITGDKPAFAAYWNKVMSTLARSRTPPALLAPDTNHLTRPGLLTQVCALSHGTRLQIAVSGPVDQKTAQRMAPAKLGGPRHCAFFWPVSTGWHAVQLEEADGGRILDRSWRYTYPRDTWTAEGHRIRQEATLARLDEARTSGPGEGKHVIGQRAVTQPLNPLWPWLLFLLASTVLWIERRLDH